MTLGVLVAAAGSLADIGTTWMALQRGLREKAPVMEWVVERIGWKAMLMLNTVLSVAFIWWLSTWGPVAVGGLVMFGLGRALLGYHNYKKLA
jgi:hypothetical protein